MIRAKGVQLALSLIAAIGVVLLPSSTRAAFAGVWQTPLTFWLVDGYGFGESTGSGYHLGEDAHGDAGTPVYAAANGTVKLAKDMNSGGWGGIILIQNTNQAGDTVVSLHGHLDAASFQVQEGQTVTRGQLLGYLGDSAHNGGWFPHLHFGIRNGQYVDAWNGEPWVYYGYGDSDDLADWFAPTDYIKAHEHVIEVERVPDNSPNRYSTAVGVSQRRFPQQDTAPRVYLASGQAFADALAAAPLTSKSSAPLLLTAADKLPTETAAEINRVLPKGLTVYLLGGDKSISTTVEQSVKNLGYKTSRIAGTSREGTAATIAAKFANSPAVFIVHRDAFPDAVSAGGPANALGIPLLFTGTTSLNDTTQRYLQDHPSIQNAYIIGGTKIISSHVATELKQIKSLKTVLRFGGANRYESNLSVVSAFTAKPETLVFATGANYPDALTGSALIGSEKGALLLANPAGTGQSTQTFINTTRAALDAALVIGGTAAIGGSFDGELAAQLNAPLTTASLMSSAQPATLKSVTLNSSNPVVLAGVSVPSIKGLSTFEHVSNGAVVSSLAARELSDEDPPAVTVSRIPLDGLSPTARLAAWFNLPESYLKTHQTKQGETMALNELPTFIPAEMRYSVDGSELVLVEVRLPDAPAEQVLSSITW
ncbi:MAG: cell wall-binding repeat-containing protein [Candidatus Andersenbacteria bacterium]